jgi:hypothetical protein
MAAEALKQKLDFIKLNLEGKACMRRIEDSMG